MKFVATKKGKTTNFSPSSFVAFVGSGLRDLGSGMDKNNMTSPEAVRKNLVVIISSVEVVFNIIITSTNEFSFIIPVPHNFVSRKKLKN